MRTSRFPISFFDRTPAGRIMTRFSSDYNNVFRIFGGPLAEFATLIFDLTAMTILIAMANPWLFLIWILQGAMSYAVYRAFLPRLRIERRELALRRSPGIAHFNETLSGVATIRVFGREESFQKRFAELNGSYLKQRENTVRVFIFFSLAMNGVTALTLLLMGLASYKLSQAGKISVGAMGVAFVYVGLAAGILQSVFEWLGQFEEAMSGLERMNEYLRSPLEPGATLPIQAQFKTGHPVDSSPVRTLTPPAGFRGEIEIRDLTLRYRSDLEPVLKSIHLNVREGERLAVVGKTGSGKTSLVQALFRLYPLEKGTIQLGGYQAETGESEPSGGNYLALDRYRSLLSYITQDATLFIGTLRDNLDPSALMH
ncbi:MAG: ABC transporter ATP-binding protein, partial [Proteobacteria bacterium]